MLSIAFTTTIPSFTFPNTTCLPSNQAVAAVVMKNWLPFVFGPAFAIERQKGSCLSLKFSSSKALPQIDLPPVPSPRVKSPPWIIKLGMIRWNLLPSYASFTSLSTILPSHRVTKFYTVFGTSLPNMFSFISPASASPMFTEKMTSWVGFNYIKMHLLHQVQIPIQMISGGRRWFASLLTS